MKRLLFPLIAVLISASVSFFLQGCTVRFVVNQQATPVPYPNAWHIELRVRAQINRISAGLQQGQLSQDSADVLAANDALVRHFVREYQGPPAEMTDLNPQQTAQLGNMLTDNDRFIDSALQNNQAWDSYFQNGNYDYRSSDHVLYLGYLDYQLNRQVADMKAAQASGRLTPGQAKEIGNRIQTIRSMRQNYYRSNGRFDLTEEQVSQLSQMTEDNGGYLRYRTNGSQGSWNKGRFNTWKTQAPSGLDQGGNPHWGRNQNNNVPSSGAVPAFPHPSSNGPHSQDSVSQNGVNPHASSSLTVSTSSPHSVLGQTVQSPRILPTPTMAIAIRQPVQAPAMTFTPVPSRNLGQTTQPTPVLAAPMNTSVLKFQAPVATPTNPLVKVQKPVFNPTPKWVRPTIKAIKAPVKAKPTPTQAPKKDDQESQDQKGDDHEKKPGGPHGD